MALAPLPTTLDDLDLRSWDTFSPYYEELEERELTPENARRWLTDWSDLSRLMREAISWTYLQKALDTADEERERAYLEMVKQVYPRAMVADQALKERLLALDLPDEDLALMLRNMENEASLFRQENVPLLTELRELVNEYDNVTAAMKTTWNGEEKNLNELEVFLQSRDRAERERAWKAIMELWLGERETLNRLYADMLRLRSKIAANAGVPDYRAYAFRERGRFAYTPEDCFVFHEAIEAEVVPAARRILEKKRARLGLDVLRPWDVDVEPGEAPPLRPYETEEELIEGSRTIFEQVDPELGRTFAVLAEEALLDLQTRQGKKLGGFCMSLPMRRRPFIFMNGKCLHDDVQTLLHEAGHAFHAFATLDLPLIWQTRAPMEFNEVASMALELLAGPYLPAEKGGFYTREEAARARIEHLEGIILFLPYMAVVDAFQHWVYTHPEEALDSDRCDAAWDALWQRFMPVASWEGFEDARETGWHRKLHIFQAPFYYIEYGMAEVGALQVWRNSLEDPDEALAAYRRALALGGTRTLPELFAAAGAEFRFDAPLLRELVGLVEETIERLEAEATQSPG